MSRLSWNQIRVNAARFADEWKQARYERGETQSFYNDFFEVFGVNRRKVATFEKPVKKLGGKQGFIDLFWKGVLMVEQKSAGRQRAGLRSLRARNQRTRRRAIWVVVHNNKEHIYAYRHGNLRTVRTHTGYD